MAEIPEKRKIRQPLPKDVAEEIIELMKQQKGRDVLDIGANYDLTTFEQIELEVIKVTGRTWRTRELERDVARELVNLLRDGYEEQALAIGAAHGLRTIEEIERACQKLGITYKRLDRKTAQQLISLIKDNKTTDALLIGAEYGFATIAEIQEACRRLGID